MSAGLTTNDLHSHLLHSHVLAMLQVNIAITYCRLIFLRVIFAIFSSCPELLCPFSLGQVSSNKHCWYPTWVSVSESLCVRHVQTSLEYLLKLNLMPQKLSKKTFCYWLLTVKHLKWLSKLLCESLCVDIEIFICTSSWCCICWK